MALVTKFAYQRLEHEGDFDDYDEASERAIVRSRKCYRPKRVPIGRRFKLKVRGLRRLLRKVRLLRTVRQSWAGVLKRFKDGQAHFGDLFAGNYLFIQVNPTSLAYLKKQHDLNNLSSRYSLPRVA